MSTEDGYAARVRAAMRTLVATFAFACATCALMATNACLPRADATPLPTDDRGFVGTPARCGDGQDPIFAGRTALSLTAICRDARGRYEYRGMRLRDGALLTLPATRLGNGCFGASTNEITYTVSERKLLLTAGLRIVRDEAMVQVLDFAEPEQAAVTKASGEAG